MFNTSIQYNNTHILLTLGYRILNVQYRLQEELVQEFTKYVTGRVSQKIAQIIYFLSSENKKY